MVPRPRQSDPGCQWQARTVDPEDDGMRRTAVPLLPLAPTPRRGSAAGRGPHEGSPQNHLHTRLSGCALSKCLRTTSVSGTR